MRYVEPIPGHYDASDPFGNPRPNGTRHHGSDWNGVPEGYEFQIVADGTVVINQWSTVLGNVLGVQNDDGMFVSYCHQLTVNPHPIGARVALGDPGGQVGSTGSASTGPHLHMGMGSTIDAIWGISPLVDPYAYITAHLTDTASNGSTPFPPTNQEEAEMSGIALYKDADNGIVYARDLTAPATVPALTIVGKPGSPSVGFTGAGLDHYSIASLSSKDMTTAIGFWGVQPVSAAQFAVFKNNVPAVKGLKSI
jgi:murein DD-endopeptidase MepM/ murein hydrolase activator NlpD